MSRPEEQPASFNPPPADWDLARPVHPPGPTLYPGVLALGVTLMIWGLVSSGIIAVFGVVLFVVALAGWIQDIRNERRSRS